MDRIELYDTTLRDGAQQEGISLSVEDKLAITRRLDSLGVHVIEGGYAGANPKDDEYFRRVGALQLKHAQIAAFGNTRRAGVRGDADQSLKALVAAGAPIVTIVGKASRMQVRDVLGVSLEENLAMVQDSVAFLKSAGRRVFFDAEHFFDGFHVDSEYALRVLEVALAAGAERLVLCDTNGGAMPGDAATITGEVIKRVSDRGGSPEHVGIHAHNDSDMAVAVSLACLQAGARHVQGTVNGYGERTGNANLVSIIANLKLKLGSNCVSDSQLGMLTDVSRSVAETVNRSHFAFQPFVGKSAFAHKGGLHAAATERAPQAYQHIDPAVVGNSNSVIVSELAGRGTVSRRVRELGLHHELTDANIRRVLEHVKAHEARGFAYEDADASFELVVRRNLPNYEAPFELIDFMVIVENRLAHRVAPSSGTGTGGRAPSGASAVPLLSEATIKVRVGEEVLHTAAEGGGPVSALDNALRKALTLSNPELRQVRLTDYKVRVVNEGAGTGAAVRVLIESADNHRIWRTVGASQNILEASWLALADSLEWWLVRSRGG